MNTVVDNGLRAYMFSNSSSVATLGYLNTGRPELLANHGVGIVCGNVATAGGPCLDDIIIPLRQIGAWGLCETARDYREESSVVREQDEKLADLRKYYQIEDEISVKHFLLGNAFIIDYLLEAPDKIENVFGADAKLALELSGYDESDVEDIVIAILSPFDVEITLRLHNQLDDEWALSVFKATDCKLVTVVNCT
ncbi:MAG: hypothetical protein HZA22_07680 [Nitrospirae bacterium]|nr:hypothetical protein [Nitrospirota bacterium]